MRIRHIALACGLAVCTQARADHLLFPVVVSNPGKVATLVTVMNMGSNHGYLRYQYFYKLPDDSGVCLTTSFERSTHPGDVVTFDVSGTFLGGYAMNDDPDDYGGGFSLGGGSTAYRGYLLVNHYDPATKLATKEGAYTLSGQATILDLTSGSAWGYQAVNETKNDEKPDFKAVTSAVPLGQSVPFAFMPPATWTTKFFIIPVSADLSDAAATQALTKVSLTIANQNSSISPPAFSCQGTIDLAAVMSRTTLVNVRDSGGWGTIKVESASTNSPALIYKLEYTYSGDYVETGHSANNGMMLVR